MKKIQVPYSEYEFDSFKTLDVYEHIHHPTVQEELILQFDALKLRMYLRQDLLEQLIEKVHSPLYLGQVILDEVMQEVALIVWGACWNG